VTETTPPAGRVGEQVRLERSGGLMGIQVAAAIGSTQRLILAKSAGQAFLPGKPEILQQPR
jgi:hypothetical protein